jgi:hypothetical protein
VTTFGDRMRLQAEQCRLMGSPLTGALLEGAAADLDRGGAVAQVVRPYLDLPAGAVAALRFAGALHRLVLEGRAPELAQHYPSSGGTAPVEEVWPAAVRTCREHLGELQQLMARTVQTNEVGRSAVLFGALGMIPGPVRLLEVGASAGLNLRCDHFAYATGTLVLGDPASPVRLEEPWVNPPPVRHPLQVVERKGCDPHPIDPTTADGRLTLTSFVWGDQVARLERLRGALDVAARVPAVVEDAGALEFLTRELAEHRDDTTTVVWHSVVWQYIDPAERKAVDKLLATAGRLIRIGLEPEAVDDSFVFRASATTWPAGHRVHLADALGHGPPVRWTGATIEL